MTARMGPLQRALAEACDLPPGLRFVRSGRGAFAVCLNGCGCIHTPHDPVPWRARNTQGMHEDGTGHRVLLADLVQA